MNIYQLIDDLALKLTDPMSYLESLAQGYFSSSPWADKKLINALDHLWQKANDDPDFTVDSLTEEETQLLCDVSPLYDKMNKITEIMAELSKAYDALEDMPK